MEIDLTDLFGKTKVLNSMEAERGAARLMNRIETGEMGMEILPGSAIKYTGDEEEKDYLSYCTFLNSKAGRQILDMLEEKNERERTDIWRSGELFREGKNSGTL